MPAAPNQKTIKFFKELTRISSKMESVLCARNFKRAMVNFSTNHPTVKPETIMMKK